MKKSELEQSIHGIQDSGYYGKDSIQTDHTRKYTKKSSFIMTMRKIFFTMFSNPYLANQERSKLTKKEQRRIGWIIILMVSVLGIFFVVIGL